MGLAVMQFDSAQHRSKEATYGKTSRKMVTTFHDDSPSPIGNASTPPIAREGRLKHIQGKNTSPANIGIFDVPSSDDETSVKSAQTALPRPLKARSKQFSNRPAQPVRQQERKESQDVSSLSELSSRKRRRLLDTSKMNRGFPSKRNDHQIPLQHQYESHDTPSVQSSRSPSHSSTTVHLKDSENDILILTQTTSQRRPATRRLADPDADRIAFSRHSAPLMSPTAGDDVDMFTPPRQTNPPGTPKSSSKGTLTPRQAQMWKNLLGDDLDTSPTGSRCQKDFDSLRDDTVQDSRKCNKAHRLMPRRKLVDSLSQPPSRYASESDLSDVYLEGEENAENAASMSNSKSTPVGESQISIDSTERSMHSTSQLALVSENGPTVTYASQRSFLKEPTPDFEESLQRSLLADLNQSSRKNQKNQLELENDQGVDGMRSIHDLRASGDNARFDDQMNILLQDIEDGSRISVKRNAILDLAKLLSDSSYLTRFVEGGYESQIFALVQNEEDLILSAAVAWASISLLDSKFNAQIVFNIYDVGVLKMLEKILYMDRDLTWIARERNANMSRIAQESVTDFCAHVKNSSVWLGDGETVVSPRLLALMCIDLLVRRMRDCGNFDPILDRSLVASLLSGITSKKSSTSPRIWNLTLSILESFTIGPKTTSSQISWSASELSQLVDLCESGICDNENTTTVLQTLRLLINLTNNQESNCNIFSSARLIHELMNLIVNCFEMLSTPLEERVRLELLDQLVLSLGVMINVAEWSDIARLTAIEPDAATLNSLVRLFVEGRDVASLADSLAEGQSNVGHGYLAVLLSNLSLNDRVRAQILLGLPKNRLGMLVEALEEFSMIHKKVDLEEAESRGGDSTWAALSQRLQIVADTLRQCESA